MKPSDSTATGRAPAREPEQDEFVSRKLIRPALRKEDGTESAPEPRLRRTPERVRAGAATATEQTHAEDFYYQKQMAARTLMTVVLKSGEVVHGVIDWYDRNAIKLNRTGRPNLLLYKQGIRYMHKAEETRS